MSKLFNGVLAGALVLSFSASAPARADTATTVAGVLLLSAAVTAVRLATTDTDGTSENTQYALTGVGTPQISTRQEDAWNAFRANSN